MRTLILIITSILIILLLFNKSNSKSTEYFDTSTNNSCTSFESALKTYEGLAKKVTDLETKTAKITATETGINVDRSITFDNSWVITSTQAFPDTLFIMKSKDYRPINRMTHETEDKKPSRVEIKVSDNSSPLINYVINNSRQKLIYYTPTIPVKSILIRRWGTGYLSFYKIRIYSSWTNGKNLTTTDFMRRDDNTVLQIWGRDNQYEQSSAFANNTTQFGTINTINKVNDSSKMVHTEKSATDQMHGIYYNFNNYPSINKIIIINRDGFRGRLKGARVGLTDYYGNLFYESDKIMGLTGNTTYTDDNDGYDIYSFIFPNKTPIGQNKSDIGLDIYNKLIISDDDLLTTMPIP